ncbi:molecular chaperone DnaK [Gammaproteobacteria bacterium]|nr:molecular chaperone DnaK [Gammaproteobacteria bacterium]
MSTCIGIDLGTTNSCVAVMEGGKPKVLENSEGNATTPSYVAFMNGEIKKGSTAKRGAVNNPENTVFAFKRYVGHKLSDKVVQNSKVPYTLKSAKNGDLRIAVHVNDKEELWSPEQLSAQILTKMKETAEDYLGHEVTSAVVTVPAYFNDAQRQATKDAGRIAGLDVKRIINEPTAAALAYGLDKKRGDRKIAVYDLGGGTFDVSIIEISDIDGDHQFEVLATNGDTFLGGEDFDEAIINHLADEFKKEQGIDLRSDKLALQRLKEAAEKAKIELSSSQKSEISLPFISARDGAPIHLNRDLTRAKLEELTDALVSRTISPCEIAVKDSGISVDEIDEVILVGGQTRMPKVQEEVEKFFNKKPRKDVNPDEAVAVGAAIQGAVLTGDVKDILLLDVTPLSLGLETLGGVMTKLIKKNTTIPTKASQAFSTAADNQTAVTVHVLQGEREMASSNKSLGEFTLGDIAAAPRGMPQIEVTFNIDANGILKVSAKDKATNKEQSITIKAAGGLSEEEIERMIQDAEKHAESDKVFQETANLTNQAESTVYGLKKSMNEHADKLTDEEKSAIDNAMTDLESAIAAKDKALMESGMTALQTASSGFMQKVYQQDANAQDNAPNAEAKDAGSEGETIDAEFNEQDDQDKK